MEPTQIAAAPSAASLSPSARLTAAFLSPTKLFEDLRLNASWWPAFLVMLLSGLLFAYAVQQKVGWPQAYATILQHSPSDEAKFANMPPDQVANAKAIGAKFTSGITWGFSILILPVTAIVAAVLMGTLNFAFGGKSTFGQLFAVYMYANLPLVLKSLLAIATLFAGLDANTFLLSNSLGSNPGYYLAPDAAPWLMTLANSLDLFTFWKLALLVIGCAAVARVSRASAATAVLGWWLLMVGGSTIWAAFKA